MVPITPVFDEARAATEAASFPAAPPTGRGPLPVRHRPEHEQLADDEAETIAELRQVFVDMAQTVARKEGQAHRAVHAKGQGLLKGQLVVLKHLPEELAQGLFAQPGQYETLVRFSAPPAEQLPDGVSSPRAMAVKVIGVSGERVPESTGEQTQDFLMVNGPAFTSPGPKGFLKSAKLLAMTTEKAPGAKKFLSAALRGAEALIEAVGGESAKLKGLGGQPLTHPLAETYFTQVPFLYGLYMAKFSLVPVSPALTALQDARLDSDEDDGQRDAINAFFADPLQAPAEWELRAQLCVDTEKMPIEDASVEWDTDLSPFIAVARLVVPPQTAWDAATSPGQEAALSFDPWHALAAHRPLGALNRARRIVMAASRQFRSDFNRCPIHEPR